MNDTIWRLSIFLGVLVIMAALEVIIPRREQDVPREIRWPRNLGIILIDNILVRFITPLTAGAVAIFASTNGVGLFNWVELPSILVFALIILALDLLIYGQHVLFHKVPMLWRLHMVHHIDQEIDVTTGIRFHPIEIILSIFIKSTAVLLLGAPFWPVVVFEIILNASSMFNHANVKLPLWLDKTMRKTIVTPDMHRVHHSVRPNETHSNFGFALAIWDRIFKTYVDQPEGGHEGMTIGLPQYQDSKKTSLIAMLLHPFRKM